MGTGFGDAGQRIGFSTAQAVARIVHIEVLPLAVLHTVDKRWLYMKTAVDDFCIGDHHIEQRSLARSQRIGDKRLHIRVSAKNAGIARHLVHTDIER